jgi:anaerobic magnesium-protoporphyrin IX monomethyl ester cyclase
MGFFLAIAPWPYSDLYPELEPYVATRDYRKYNLVEPVVKPKNMTLAELEVELGKASQKFFMHKFQNLHQLSPWKQEFMLSVLDVLINHSYLAGQMKAAMRGGKEMPEEVKQLMLTVKGHGQGMQHVVPPIP